jgi:hypothetical protein
MDPHVDWRRAVAADEQKKYVREWKGAVTKIKGSTSLDRESARRGIRSRNRFIGRD